MEHLKAIAARSPEIRSYDSDRLELFTTPRAILKLKELKVFFGRPNNRFKPTDVLTIPTTARIEPYACFPVGMNLIDMGAFSYSESPLPAGMKVGRYCSIASGLQILRDRHPMEWVTTSSVTYDFEERKGYRSFVEAQKDFNNNEMVPQRPDDLFIDPPVIENDVWIGQNVQLARGIRIGNGAIVGAGALVTRDVKPYEIVGGIPAKTIRTRFPKFIADGLMESKWWECDPSVLRKFGFKDPVEFLHNFKSGSPEPFRPKPITAADVILMLDI